MRKRKYVLGAAFTGCLVAAVAMASPALAEITLPTPNPNPPPAADDPSVEPLAAAGDPSVENVGTGSDVSLAVVAAQAIAQGDAAARAASLTTTIDEYMEHFGPDAAGAVPEGTEVSVVAVTGSDLTASVHLPYGYAERDLKVTSVVTAIDSNGLQVSRSIQMSPSLAARGGTSADDPEKLLEGFSTEPEEIAIR